MTLPNTASPHPELSFSVLPDIFEQSRLETENDMFDNAIHDFGRMDCLRPHDVEVIEHGDGVSSNGPSIPLRRVPNSWETLNEYIKHLNTSAPSETSYRILYLSRHGEGVHNVAEREYGRENWDSTYSRLTFDPLRPDLPNWLDAPLTARGRWQAAEARSFWRYMLQQGACAPQRFYVSPLVRCLETAQRTWPGLVPIWQPIVQEGLREVFGAHTCDKRSRTSDLRQRYSMMNFQFPSEMSEEDELWKADHRETDAETDVRVKAFLNSIWAYPGAVVSLTTHSGWIRSALRVIGHREWRLKTGDCLPVVVKGVKKSNQISIGDKPE